MYQFISRPGCYYTDTDSVFLDKPLPEVSSSELVKMKLECRVREGIFLAPKISSLEVEDDQHIVRYEVPAKGLVDHHWFRNQYSDLRKYRSCRKKANFEVSWKTLDICQRDRYLNLGIQLDSERDSVCDENGRWIDTLPKKVKDRVVISQNDPANDSSACPPRRTEGKQFGEQSMSYPRK